MRKALGITLIELIVTVAIAAFLMTLAAPSFKRLVQSNNMSGAVNAFMSDVRFARSEAVRYGGRVVMCRSADPENPAPACAAAGATTQGWASGWIIFQDLNGDDDWTAGDRILRVQGPLTTMDSILERTVTAATKLKFTATGRLYDTSLATEWKFGGSSFEPTYQRVVCISAGGRARIAGDGNSTCGTSIE
jgi:type IV fimbrial biogenesis protein FimT